MTLCDNKWEAALLVHNAEPHETSSQYVAQGQRPSMMYTSSTHLEEVGQKREVEERRKQSRMKIARKAMDTATRKERPGEPSVRGMINQKKKLRAGRLDKT